MAARTPAGAAGEERAVIASADKDAARLRLLLEVAFQTKIRVPLRQHLVVDRAMRIVAGGAALANRFMFENKRPALRSVTLRARVRIGRHGEWSPRCGLASVRIMAIAAAHFPVANRMSMLQLKTTFHFEMAGEANFRITVRVDDGVARAAGLIVQAAGAMAAFASDVFRVGAVRHHPRMGGAREMFVHFRVALGAGFRSYKFRAGNIRWHKHGAVDRDARDQYAG